MSLRDLIMVLCWATLNGSLRTKGILFGVGGWGHTHWCSCLFIQGSFLVVPGKPYWVLWDQIWVSFVKDTSALTLVLSLRPQGPKESYLGWYVHSLWVLPHLKTVFLSISSTTPMAGPWQVIKSFLQLEIHLRVIPAVGPLQNQLWELQDYMATWLPLNHLLLLSACP